MKLIRHPDDLPEELRHGALAIGNFDGVHRGHALIVERLVAWARELGGPAVVLTLDPHPATILRPHYIPPPLTWIERKAELLGRLGVDALIAYPTDESFLEMTAQDFFDRIVRDWLQARAMVEGVNFFFGRDRRGDVHRLQAFCKAVGVTLDVIEPLETDGRIVSSSRIRELIAAGRIDRAGQMLTQPYRIRGTVVRGEGRGRKLGYPTANLEQIDTLLPGEGIYAGRALVDGVAWPAAVNIGPNPTFGEGRLKVEAFLIGFKSSLYDQSIEIDFLSRLRDIVRFDSAGALVAQLDRDAAAAKKVADGG